MSKERESELLVSLAPSGLLQTLMDGRTRAEGNHVGQLEGFLQSGNLSPLDACLPPECDRWCIQSEW